MLTLKSENGNTYSSVLDARLNPLATQRYLCLFVSSIFPVLQSGSFKGSLLIEVVGSGDIAVMGLSYKEGQLSSIPVALAQAGSISSNKITNGDFTQGLTGWTSVNGGPCGTRTTDIMASDPPFSQALRLMSVNGPGCGGGSSAEQSLDIDVSGTTPLMLSADVKAVSSDVRSGCGDVGREYPIQFQIEYLDSSNIARMLVIAFYYGGGTCGNPSGMDSTVTYLTVPLSQNQWFSYSSPNLKGYIPNGSRITKVRVHANGWDYEGHADNISLIQ
jgi:hypothetical protein